MLHLVSILGNLVYSIVYSDRASQFLIFCCHLELSPLPSQERRLELLFICGAKYLQVRNSLGVFGVRKSRIYWQNRPHSGTWRRSRLAIVWPLRPNRFEGCPSKPKVSLFLMQAEPGRLTARGPLNQAKSFLTLPVSDHVKT